MEEGCFIPTVCCNFSGFLPEKELEKTDVSYQITRILRIIFFGNCPIFPDASCLLITYRSDFPHFSCCFCLHSVQFFLIQETDRISLIFLFSLALCSSFPHLGNIFFSKRFFCIPVYVFKKSKNRGGLFSKNMITALSTPICLPKPVS